MVHSKEVLQVCGAAKEDLALWVEEALPVQVKAAR